MLTYYSSSSERNRLLEMGHRTIHLHDRLRLASSICRISAQSLSILYDNRSTNYRHRLPHRRSATIFVRKIA